MATPEMMWSTPTVTVTRACSMPPSNPQNTPKATPAQAPHW